MDGRFGGTVIRNELKTHVKESKPVGEGEGGMFQENSIETCILSMVKQITSPGGMHEISAHA